MNTALLAALTDTELASHFDAKVLARGRALTGGVSHTQPGQEGALHSISANVRSSGPTPYRVQLSHAPGTRLRGRCECVYAESGLPCKHQAALALVWRAQRSGQALNAAAPPAPPASSKRRAVPALEALPANELLRRLIALAERHPELRDELLAGAAGSAPATAASLPLVEAKKQVTSLLAAPRDLFEWRRVGAYVRKAEGVLALLQGWVTSDPQLALEACEWALVKLRRVWQAADDSSGDIATLMQALAGQFLSSLQAAGPQAKTFAERYAKLVEADEHDLFDHAALLAAMGPQAAQRYGEIVDKAWRACSEQAREIGNPAWGALRRLLAHLAAVGDASGELELRRATLSDVIDHGEMIDALTRLQRPREALAAAEAAHRRFPDHPHISQRLLRAYEADGWDAEALALHQQLFERSPSLAQYEASLAAAQRQGQAVATAVRERLWRWLASEGQQQLGFGTLAELQLQLWAHEARWQEALDWIAAQSQQQLSALGADRLRQFAITLPLVHDEIAAELLKTALRWSLERASSPYTRQLQLVQQTLARLTPPQRQLWLAWLRVEHKAKRRFVEGLVGL